MKIRHQAKSAETDFFKKKQIKGDFVNGFEVGSKFTFDTFIELLDNEIKRLDTFPVLGERRVAMSKMRELLSIYFKELTNVASI